MVKPTQPKPNKPQKIKHIKIKEAINDPAFLMWLNKKYPNR